MPSAYLLFKLVHVLAVIAFLGNISTGILWKKHADRTGDVRLMAHALAGVIRSDRWFTLPGVAGILIGGIGGAMAGGVPMLGTGWVLWGIVLFSISGIAFMTRVAPLQRRMLALTSVAAQGGQFDHAEYERCSRQWDLWGAVALLTPLAAAVIMVLKPELPTLS